MNADQQDRAGEAFMVVRGPHSTDVIAVSPELLAEAEDRGYRRAIEALLDDESYRRWENANNVAPAGARSHVSVVLRHVCADYLGWLDDSAREITS